MAVFHLWFYDPTVDSQVSPLTSSEYGQDLLENLLLPKEVKCLLGTSAGLPALHKQQCVTEKRAGGVEIYLAN